MPGPEKRIVYVLRSDSDPDATTSASRATYPRACAGTTMAHPGIRCRAVHGPSSCPSNSRPNAMPCASRNTSSPARAAPSRSATSRKTREVRTSCSTGSGCRHPRTFAQPSSRQGAITSVPNTTSLKAAERVHYAVRASSCVSLLCSSVVCTDLARRPSAARWPRPRSRRSAQRSVSPRTRLEIR